MDIEHLLIWSRAKLIRRREVESNCNAEAYAISTGLGTHPTFARSSSIATPDSIENWSSEGP